MGRLSLENIQEASRVIDPVFLNGPQYWSEALSRELGTKIFVKVETQNPIRSFKGRGADYWVSKLRGDERLVCASAGNFGQGLAYAARKRGIALTIFASVNANPLKIERMQSLGAQVSLAGEDFDAAKLLAKEYAAKTGALMVEDGLIPEISEGAGSIAVELLKQDNPPATWLIPLGNGALLSGVGSWVKAVRPDIKVIGVAAQGAPAMERSWRSGELVVFDRIDTIADGIGVRIPIPEALEDLKNVVDEILLVNDEAIIQGMKLIHRHLGLVAEPSAAVGIAAVAAYPKMLTEERVATIICGGNLTPEQMKNWLG